ERAGIEHFDTELVREAAEAGRSVRLVASLDRDARGLHARVRPQWVDRDHAFAKTSNEENCLEIHPEDGDVVYVRGKGAGRWPATESVMADVFDVCRAGKSDVAERCLAAGRSL